MILLEQLLLFLELLPGECFVHQERIFQRQPVFLLNMKNRMELFRREIPQSDGDISELLPGAPLHADDLLNLWRIYEAESV